MSPGTGKIQGREKYKESTRIAPLVFAVGRGRNFHILQTKQHAKLQTSKKNRRAVSGNYPEFRGKGIWVMGEESLWLAAIEIRECLCDLRFYVLHVPRPQPITGRRKSTDFWLKSQNQKSGWPQFRYPLRHSHLNLRAGDNRYSQPCAQRRTLQKWISGAKLR